MNLPVHNIDRARTFFAVGFSFEEAFCTDDTLAMTINDSCHAMLLERARFASFSPGPVADPHKSAQALIAVQLDSRGAVDALMDLAVANGGTDVRGPVDRGFMYGRARRPGRTRMGAILDFSRRGRLSDGSRITNCENFPLVRQRGGGCGPLLCVALAGQQDRRHYALRPRPASGCGDFHARGSTIHGAQRRPNLQAD